MRGTPLAYITAMLLGSVGVPAQAVSRKDPPPDCPEGTSWHEADPQAEVGTGEEVPARVGWCVTATGVKHGPMRTWWPSGWLRTLTTYDHGVESGPALAYYADGRPEHEATQVLGKPDGRYVQWHPNGQRARVMHYHAGRPHGWATYWSDAGRVTAEGAFVEGRKVGVWESWYPSGVLKDVARWEDGQLHGRQLTFSEGGLFAHGACWERGEKRWETKSEPDARTRRCSPW